MDSQFSNSVVQKVALLVLALIAAAALVAAQVTVATIQGRVVDSQGGVVPGATVTLEQTGKAVKTATTNADGAFLLRDVAPGSYQLKVVMSGFRPTIVAVTPRAGQRLVLGDIAVVVGAAAEAVDVVAEGSKIQAQSGERSFSMPGTVNAAPPMPASAPVGAGRGGGRVGGVYLPGRGYAGDFVYSPERREGYASVRPNRFRRTADEPLSTFGADVDTASFANARRFLRNGQLPPVEAVRVEEFVNYFRFDYGSPRAGHPIGVTTEVAECPWAPTHKLVLIGARASSMSNREITGRNIVLLVDVSGSMASDDKLPLLRSAFGVFVNTLQPTDRIAIVTYAGQTGVALPPTPVRDRERILSVINGLGAGGSTNGAGGIAAAYQLARQSFIEGGVNRVILATDGDFNVGVTSHDGLLKLIEREKESGVFLSVLGVGTGNLQDATMEMLADKGNGHYSYLDSLQEARRVLVREVTSTLETVAKDVKFQVEFNPAEVAAWKQIGYENRVLAHEDFNDDRKDGGEMGAGHTVTVLYEIVPVGVPVATSREDDDPDARPDVDPLRYQTSTASRPRAQAAEGRRGEWLTVKVRYQQPDGKTSRLVEQPLAVQSTARPVHLPFAAAVAEYGLLLRDGQSNRARWNALIRRVEQMPVASAREGDKNHLLELATTARDLVRIR